MTVLEHRPIGIFDSGCGGLTIFRTIRDISPPHRFVYLGDHANGPYGDKDESAIYELTCRGVQNLFDCGCKLVLLACNTASAVALRRLQEEWLPTKHPDKRVLGVLIPLIEEVIQKRWARGPATMLAPQQHPQETIGVLATPATVDSDTYRREITSRAPQIEIVQQACPGLADAIDQNARPSELGRLIRSHVQALLAKAEGRPLKRVILGCTHYPLVTAHFREALPPGSHVIEQDAIVARSLADYLVRHEVFAPEMGPAGTVFLTTGDAARASHLAQRFLGGPASFLRIDGS